MCNADFGVTSGTESDGKMPKSKEYNTITAIWVDAKLLYRPANVSDPSAEMEAKYKPTGDEAFAQKQKTM